MASRKKAGASLLERCLLFWCPPTLFILLKLGTLSGEEKAGEFTDLVQTLCFIFVISIGHFVLDLTFRLQGRGLIVQLALQLLIIASSVDLIPSLFGSGAANELTNQVEAPHHSGSRKGGVAFAQTNVHVESQSKTLALEPSAASEADEHAEHAAAGLEVEPERMSIVLPCLNETRFVVNTVLSFCQRTPKDVLQEIIVVDDGSSPPLEGELKKHNIPEECRLRVLRHDKPFGLMIAKQTGGDAALGKFVGFYDCHVAPRLGWEVETIKLLKEQPRRLVVPMIGDLDVDKWDEKEHGALTAKCYINFNADFWWYDDESDAIPVISGGLVATTKYWWTLSGGYDRAMRGWGGENTDQSLRAWLCGGDILRAKSSVIAHMWRVTTDKRTLAKYHFQGQTDNLARVAAMWFDEFKVKFRGGNLRSNIDVSEFMKLREKLQCKPFAYFLHRFRRVYIKGAVIPKEVFRIKSKISGKCIQRSGHGYKLVADCDHATWFQNANQRQPGFPREDSFFEESRAENPNFLQQVSCGNHKAKTCAECPQGHGAGWCHVDCTYSFGSCMKNAKFESLKQKTKSDLSCCSGIREWNSMDCWDRPSRTGPSPYSCDLTGTNANQQYYWDGQGHFRHYEGECLREEGDQLLVGSCDKATGFEESENFEPEEMRLYRQAVERDGLTDDMPDH
mmetsp:Transcript_89959/g.196937  ORF Transcript_89959/g.196937 Transcript_89959/m.196937 type:complete len:677 (+) Transcript_89959:47-2077(+)